MSYPNEQMENLVLLEQWVAKISLNLSDSILFTYKLYAFSSDHVKMQYTTLFFKNKIHCDPRS